MEQHLPHRAVDHWRAALIQVDNECGFAQLVSEQRLCVVNAAPCEIMHVMEITTDYRTGFTDKMRIKYHMRYIVQPYFLLFYLIFVCMYYVRSSSQFYQTFTINPGRGSKINF